MRSWIILCLVGLLLSVGAAEAAIYYVNQSCQGCNSNSCTAAANPNTPRQTINGGTGCLGPGDTLVVKDGTYNECLINAIPSGSAGAPTTIIAENPRQARLAPTSLASCGSTVVIIGVRGGIGFAGDVRSYIRLEGLFIDIPTSATGFGVKVLGGREDADFQDGSVGLEFINLEIQGGKNGPNTSDFSLGIGQGGNQFGWTFRNNYFHDISIVDMFNPADIGWGYALYISGHDNLIEGNEFARIAAYAIHGYSTGSHFFNNIIRNNYFHDIGGPAILVCGSNNQLYNNIIARTGTLTPHGGYRGGIRLAFGCSGVASNNNLIYNNTILWSQNPDGSSPEEGCINLSMPPIPDCGCSTATGNIVRNNLCYQGAAWINNQHDPNTVDHNHCVSGRGSTCETTGNPSLKTTINNTDLGAAGITAADFQLTTGSTPKDIGTNISLSGFTTDFGGNPRIQNGTQDLGAWEFGSAPPSNPDPIAWWKFDALVGSTIVDETGNGHTLTLTGASPPTLGPGRIGGHSLQCNGSGSDARTPAFALPQLTWTVWVQGTSAPSTTANEVILVNSTTPTDQWGMAWGHTSAAARQAAWIHDASAYTNYQIPGAALVAGGWYHMAFTADGSTAKMYLNGSQVKSATRFTQATGGGSFQLCAYAGGASPWAGLIDQMKIWDHALSAAEILAEYRMALRPPRHSGMAYR